MKNFSLIAAMTKERVIGYDNKIPWHIPQELQYFRKLTLGKLVIMGRKTFASIGKPLPNRINMVITQATNLVSQDNLFFVKSIEHALDTIEHLICPDEVMVIGGATIYKEFLPLASTLYLSIIKNNYVGNIFFPQYDEGEWLLTEVNDEKEYIAQVWRKKQH